MMIISIAYLIVTTTTLCKYYYIINDETHILLFFFNYNKFENYSCLRKMVLFMYYYLL